MSEIDNPPDLDLRFCQPKGWRWHGFERRKGRYIRFGSASPENSVPNAVIVCLPGMHDFSEKYFELAHWCLEHNFAFWIIDWAGQGKSTRLVKSNPQKRHSHGFDEDVEDLRYFIREYIKHSSVHPDKGRIPMAMIGHCAGANIGLRYLSDNAEGFECACFSTPLLGLKAYEKIPQHVGSVIEFVKCLFAGSRYIAKGGNWEKRLEYPDMTSDKKREAVEKAWMQHVPELRMGDATNRWVYEAQLSCMRFAKTVKHTPPKIPCLLAFPGKSPVIDNAHAQKIAGYLPNVKVIDYPGSGHNILMEKDDIRDNFLGHFYSLVKETIIDCPETLKPF